MKWLGKFLKRLLRVDNVKSAISNMRRKVFSTGMTDADIEASEMTLENQQILNEQEFQRKIDFYERYESPQAQVNQYKNAGLNPALMFGNGASVNASGGIGSAGSAVADSTSENLTSVLSSIMSMAFQQKQLQKQDEWRQREMDIQEQLGNRNADITEEWYRSQMPRISADVAQTIELTRGSKLDNDLKEKILPVLEDQARADYELTVQKTVQSRKEVDAIDSIIEQRRHQNAHYDAMVTQLYSLARQQNYYTDVYLPGMLSNSNTLTSAQKEELRQSAIESQERQKQIKELTREAAAQANIKEKDFENWVWLNSRPNNFRYGMYGETEYIEPPQPKEPRSRRKPADIYPW